MPGSRQTPAPTRESTAAVLQVPPDKQRPEGWAGMFPAVTALVPGASEMGTSRPEHRTLDSAPQVASSSAGPPATVLAGHEAGSRSRA